MIHSQLTPDDIKAMGVKQFQRYFGFAPRDALEKHFFAAMGRRPTPMEREAITVGIVGIPNLSDVNMED